MQKLLVSLVLLAVYCEAAVFNGGSLGNGCSRPNWKCDCRLVYRCTSNEQVAAKFPDDLSDPTSAGVIRDLAPKKYPLRVSGKRWRRNREVHEDFCKNECDDRMNAFLLLSEDGSFSDYSESAVCLHLLGLGSELGGLGPFFQEPGSSESCCVVHLEWGPQWCPNKWSRLVGGVHCFTNSALTFGSTFNPGNAHFFVANGCNPAEQVAHDDSWCEQEPMCDI